MEVKLTEISLRMLSRYYPLILFVTLINCIFLDQINWRPHLTLLGLYARVQTGIVLGYTFMVIPLYLFRPKGLVNRFLQMSIFMLLAVEIQYFESSQQYGFSPIPFCGPSFATQTFLFMISSGFFTIWFFFLTEKSIRTEKELREEESLRLLNEKRLVENRLRLLQAQIEPQFLFNTLASIMKLRDINLEKAKTMQMYFIQYLRATLVKTRVAKTTIAQEMDLIQAYLDLFRVSMEDRLYYEVDIEQGTRDLPFPSMLIQPIVENAIVHGLGPKPEGGDVLISTRKNGGSLKVIIADTGTGISENIKTGAGLSNVKERLDSLFGSLGRLMIENNNPTGLRVILEVPYV